MNRRQFLERIGISTAIIATMRIEDLEKPVSKEVELRLDQENPGSELVDFITVQVGNKEHSIPVYTLR